MNHFLFNNNRIRSKKKRERGFLFFLLGLLFFISCSDHHCKEPMVSPLVLGFYSGLDTSVQIPRDFLEITAVGTDSINSFADSIFNEFPGYDAKVRVLSLKNFNDSTNFLFISTYNNESGESIRVKDTLTVKHTNTQEFISAECGCLTTFRLDTTLLYTRHNITEAIVFNQYVTSSIVNNPDEKHIKIFFKNY